MIRVYESITVELKGDSLKTNNGLSIVSQYFDLVSLIYLFRLLTNKSDTEIIFFSEHFDVLKVSILFKPKALDEVEFDLLIDYLRLSGLEVSNEKSLLQIEEDLLNAKNDIERLFAEYPYDVAIYLQDLYTKPIKTLKPGGYIIE